MSFSNLMSSLFLHRCRRFSIKRQNFQNVRAFHNISSNTSFDEKNIFSICVLTSEHCVMKVSLDQIFFILVVARELVLTKTSELSKHTIVQYIYMFDQAFICGI